MHRCGLWLTLILLLTACGREVDPSAAPGASPAPTFALAPDGGTLTVVWVADGRLYTWSSDDPVPRPLASDDVIRPVLSPDGMQVAFLRGLDGDPQSLWTADLSGGQVQPLIDMSLLQPDDPTRRPWQIVWVGKAIYFNTLTGENISMRTADDLWRVVPASGAIERLLPDGAGGRIIPSPDGSRLAVASAGDYTQPGEAPRAPGMITIYDPATEDRTTGFEFAAVATASQWRWYPTPRWVPDGSGVRVAIPDPNLVYGTGETALWWVPVAGEPLQTGTVDADYFGLPAFSPDGDWITYVSRRETIAQTDITLMLAAHDGTQAVPYAQGRIGSLSTPDWLPDTARFIYPNGTPDTFWLGGPGLTLTRFPAENIHIGEIVWASPSTFVVSTTLDGRIALQWGTLQSPALQTITTLDTTPFFDAIIGVR